MIKHIKRLLGIGQTTATTAAPYKVEAPVAEAKPAKKPTVKKATTKQPRKPKTPKA
jgi:hypothetical protein